jgi:hypothetical protein
MEATASYVQSALPNRLRRFLLILGYVITVVYWGSFSLSYLFDPLARLPGFSGSIWLRVLELLLVAAAALLAVGIAGLQFRRRWGRAVLSVYAATWIVATLLMYVWNFLEVEVFHQTTPRTAAQQILLALEEFEYLIFYWVYPVLVLVCVWLTEAWPTRIRRVLIVGGYVLSIGYLVITALPYWISHYALFDLAPGEWPDKIMSAAVVLLLAGTAGFQHRQRWARKVLYAYAATWILGFLWMRGWTFVQLANASALYSTTRWTAGQTIARVASELWPIIDFSVFPIFLVVCLRMPELADTIREPQRGFVPVLASDEAGNV